MDVDYVVQGSVFHPFQSDFCDCSTLLMVREMGGEDLITEQMHIVNGASVLHASV